MIIIFIMITITWDGGSEENPDDDEYPSVVAKAVLAVCFDPSRTVDIDMILMMMTGMILMMMTGMILMMMTGMILMMITGMILMMMTGMILVMTGMILMSIFVCL